MSKQYYHKKNIIITGPTSGIGKSLAFKLAERGANLILISRSLEKLNLLKKELSCYDVDVFIVSADLSDKEEVKKSYDTIRDLNIEIDILINNAGFGMSTKYLSRDYSDYERMINLNVLSVINLTSLFLPGILKRKGGGIINVASTGAFQPLPYQTVYGASKSFILSYTEALYAEYFESGIHIMSLCPGFTDTNFKKASNGPDIDVKSMSPDRVALECIQSFEQKKVICVPGRQNKLLSLVPRFLSRKRIIKIMRNMFKKSFE
jgi:short-subunit dehydrogenase